MIKVLIADDHALMREGLRRILDDVDSIVVVGEATTGADVVSHDQLAHAHVILLDLSMPGYSGIELIREVHRRAPAIAVLVLTMHHEALYAIHAMRAGASGYLTKDNAALDVICAIKKVASGCPYISERLSDELVMDIGNPVSSLPHTLLSHREREIFALLVRGVSVSGAAIALDVSIKTVSTLKTRIMGKMGLNSIAHMVQYALANGLLDIEDRRYKVRQVAGGDEGRTALYPMSGTAHFRSRSPT